MADCERLIMYIMCHMLVIILLCCFCNVLSSYKCFVYSTLFKSASSVIKHVIVVIMIIAINNILIIITIILFIFLSFLYVLFIYY